MSEMMTEARKQWLLWRLAALRFCLYSAASLWTCWSTATNMVDMTLMDNWTWFQTIGGCFGSWCLVIIAYLDKSTGQIASGHIPGVEEEHKP